MREKALSLLNTATLRQSGITFAGTVLNGVLGAAFYILAARALGPASFGVLSVVLSIIMLAASIGDVGADTGVVRFVSFYLKKDKTRAYRFLKLTLKIKLISGLIISICGILLSGLIAGMFKKPELVLPLRVAFTGVLSLLLFGFVVSYLKAVQKFFLWSAVQVSANFVRVLAVLILFLAGILNTEGALWAYSLTLLLGFFAGLLFFVPKEFLYVKKENSVGRELFAYNKWIASFALIAALSSRLDTFISARLLSSTELGLYSAANQLVYIVPQIVGALGTVIAPKFAGMAKANVVGYLKKTQLLVLGLAFLGLMSAPVVAFFVPLVFGSNYVGSIPPFYVLLAAMLVFLISVPVHNVILYYYSRPRFFFWLALGHLIIVGAVGWVLVSGFGMMGAAFTVLIGSLFNFAVPALWVYRKINNKQ